MATPNPNGEPPMFDTIVTSDVLASVATLTTVVSHDISTDAVALAKPQTAYQRLENLIVQRQVWEDEVFRASNDRLYSILQLCPLCQVWQQGRGKGSDGRPCSARQSQGFRPESVGTHPDQNRQVRVRR